MNFIMNYLKNYFLNNRPFFPKKFNSNIAFANIVAFGLTSIIMFIFYEPLGYLYFLILITSTESDANISGNSLCNKIVQKIDIIIILITIIVLIYKTNLKYSVFLIPIVIMHNWKRDAKNPEEYEIKMNIWHFFAGFISVLSIVVYSLLHT